MKPANGFEPMAFALQKRCSTAELSRQRPHCTGRLSALHWRVGHQPDHELQSAATSSLCQGVAHMGFDCAHTQHQLGCDGFIAQPLE